MWGTLGLSIADGSTHNRIENVVAGGAWIALEINGDNRVQISGVDFSGSAQGLYLANIDGLELRGPIGSGLGSVDTAIALHNVDNSLISGVDVSWTGADRSGTGISLWDSQGITVQNVAAANRGQPLYSYWGASSPPTLRQSLPEQQPVQR